AYPRSGERSVPYARAHLEQLLGTVPVVHRRDRELVHRVRGRGRIRPPRCCGPLLPPAARLQLERASGPLGRSRRAGGRRMRAYVCVTCAVQQPPSEVPPKHCPMWEDERQYVRQGGEAWTTVEELRLMDHRIELRELEPGLVGV